MLIMNGKGPLIGWVLVVKRFFYDVFTGLSKRTTSEKLHEAFAAHGEVVHGMFSRGSFLVILFYLSVINSSTLCLQLE